MDRNFFNVNSINKIKQNQQNLFDEKPSNRLNGYDSGILNQNTPENEKMPFEFHITEKRNELTDVNGKIKNAEQYGTQSEVLGLKGRKQRLEKELFELNKEQFLNHLYGGMDEPELKIIDVFICKLRKKLQKATGGDDYIGTIWGRGYLLQAPEEKK